MWLRMCNSNGVCRGRYCSTTDGFRFLGGQVTSGSNTGKWVMDVIDSSTLSAKTSIALPGALMNSQSIGTSEYATISVSQ